MIIVLELGAGAALPTLLASTLPRERAPSLAVVTDYPDPTILDNLARNVSTNHELYCATSRVLWRGHEWGTDNSEILYAHLHSTLPRTCISDVTTT